MTKTKQLEYIAAIVNSPYYPQLTMTDDQSFAQQVKDNIECELSCGDTEEPEALIIY